MNTHISSVGDTGLRWGWWDMGGRWKEAITRGLCEADVRTADLRCDVRATLWREPPQRDVLSPTCAVLAIPPHVVRSKSAQRYGMLRDATLIYALRESFPAEEYSIELPYVQGHSSEDHHSQMLQTLSDQTCWTSDSALPERCIVTFSADSPANALEALSTSRLALLKQGQPSSAWRSTFRTSS